MDKLLSPWKTFPVLYLAFLLLALISFFIHQTASYLVALPTFGIDAVILIIAGLFAFILFSLLGQKIEKIDEKIVAAALIASLFFTCFIFFRNFFFSIITTAVMFLLIYHLKRLNLKRFTIAVTVIAFTAGIITLFHGIGITYGYYRETQVYNPIRPFFYSFALITAGLCAVILSRKKAIIVVSLLAGIAILEGFKVDFLAIILTFIIAYARRKSFSLKTLWPVLVTTFIIFITAATFIAHTTYTHWNIPPYLYPIYRAGFTTRVFSGVASISFPFGYLKGLGFLNPMTVDKITSVVVLNYHNPVLITSSFFGPFALDFGLLGVIIAGGFVGAVLGILYKRSGAVSLAIYAAALAHTITLIDIGFNSLSIPLYLAFLYLSVKDS